MTDPLGHWKEFIYQAMDGRDLKVSLTRGAKLNGCLRGWEGSTLFFKWLISTSAAFTCFQVDMLISH